MTNQSRPPRVATKKHIARLERDRQQTRLVRWIAFGGILIVTLIIGYGYLDLNYLQLNDPVMEINGQIVTTKEFQERVQVQRLILLNEYQNLQFQQSFGLDTTQQLQTVTFTLQSPVLLGQQTLESLKEEILVRQEAEKLGIVVSEAELEEAIQSAYGFYPNGTKTPTVTPTAVLFPTLSSQQLTLYPSTLTPSPAPTSTTAPTGTPDPAMTATATPTQAKPTPTFVPLPATATATPYTIEGYSTQYATAVENFKVNSGFSEETLRAVYEYGLIRQKVFEKITADVPRTEEQVWARHILVDDLTGVSNAQAYFDLGYGFAEVALKVSKDTGSASSGGDLGWFGRGMMVPEFENAAFSQEIGVIGEPVKSQFGYHIIQVLGHAEIPLNASQYRQQQETAFAEWLVEIESEAAILTYDIWMERVPPAPEGFGQ
jgi:parvulin-like peptidyl-prolyl isomerase